MILEVVSKKCHLKEKHAYMNSYVTAFLDMNSQNVHTVTAQFCFTTSYKRISGHKMFASDD